MDYPEPGSAEWSHLAEGNAKQARKRVVADVLFRNRAGYWLLVKPTYKKAWDLPGGMAENNESPRRAAVREVWEEVGLQIPLGGMLCVDWVPPHGPWDDQIAFIFDGGVLSDSQCATVRPRDQEISECRFFDPEGALKHLQSRLRRRALHAGKALEDRTPRYLQDGYLCT